MSGQTFELGDVLLAAMDERLAGVFTAMPAKIVSYNASEQSADVQPLIRHGYINEVGDRVTERLPVIPRVPVCFPGSGGFRLTFPVKPDDVCLLVFSNSSLDTWAHLGGETDPGDDRRHCLQDAIVIPGLRDFAHALANAPTDRLSIGADVGATIEIHPNEVRLGGDDASSGVARQGDSIDLDFTRLQGILDGRYTPSGGPLIPTVGHDGTIATSSTIVKSK